MAFIPCSVENRSLRSDGFLDHENDRGTRRRGNFVGSRVGDETALFLALSPILVARAPHYKTLRAASILMRKEATALLAKLHTTEINIEPYTGKPFI